MFAGEKKVFGSFFFDSSRVMHDFFVSFRLGEGLCHYC